MPCLGAADTGLLCDYDADLWSAAGKGPGVP